MGSNGTNTRALKIVVLVAILLTVPTVTTALAVQSQNQTSNQNIEQALGLYLYLSSLGTPFGFVSAFPNLTFDHPVGIYNAGDGSNRLFVVEQAGVIMVFNNSVNVSTDEVFLNISDQVLFSGESGLLGLAFSPNFTTDHNFYVYYVADNPIRSVIARYTVNQSNLNQANVSSEQIILVVPQPPFTNHKAGEIAFGPRDGYLYIALGDGGSEGDPMNNSQNESTLLGKILRIDVGTATPPLNYSIPPSNPFFNNTQNIRQEIYALGFRNPWRFSFDNVTGQLWAGDVGESSWEEIDIVQSGLNYGWNVMEGDHPFDVPPGFNLSTLTLPVWEYSHAVGNAIMGGYVYRGSEHPELNGSYIYGDYGSGKIWALQYDGVNPTNNTLIAYLYQQVVSFGVDENN